MDFTLLRRRTNELCCEFEQQQVQKKKSDEWKLGRDFWASAQAYSPKIVGFLPEQKLFSHEMTGWGGIKAKMGKYTKKGKISVERKNIPMDMFFVE